MLRGLYSAAAGMAVQRSKMDIITNNIVNVDTSGFKRDELVSSSFEEVLLERINGPSVEGVSSEVGSYSFGSHIDEVRTDFSQGSIEHTGTDTDIAISGDGFFAVNTKQGERYTRAGRFTVSSSGYLVTAEGGFVLGENGPVNVGSGEFAVSEDGSVSVNGELKDKLKIVRLEDDADMRKQGDSLYYPYSAVPESADEYEIMQGSLESSNVEIAEEMVSMITVYRAYEAGQKILTMTDETLGMAVNEIGSLR